MGLKSVESSASTVSYAVIFSGCAFLAIVTSMPALYYMMNEMSAKLETSRVGFEETANILWNELVTTEKHSRNPRQTYKQSAPAAGGAAPSEVVVDNTCPPGPSGEPGVAGEPGTDGEPGQAGKDGSPGTTTQNEVPQGACLPCPSGPPGAPGYKGKRGGRGSKGEKGAPGNPGRNGAPGEEGPEGDYGHPGPVGPVGEKGANGENARGYTKGAVGPKGESGVQGMAGDEGLPGERGEDGTPGAQGEQGPPGAPGEKGPEGYPGLPGNAGGAGEDAAYCPCPSRRGEKPAEVYKEEAPEAAGAVPVTAAQYVSSSYATQPPPVETTAAPNEYKKGAPPAKEAPAEFVEGSGESAGPPPDVPKIAAPSYPGGSKSRVRY